MTPLLAIAALVSVLLPDGNPATGAQAASLTKSRFAHIVGDQFQRPIEKEVVFTDSRGQLAVSHENAGRWIVLHPQGWADTTLTPDTAELRLEPWHLISGTLSAPFEPGSEVSYIRNEPPQPNPENPGTVFWTSRAPIDESGRFSLTQVPTGHGSVGLSRHWKSKHHEMRWRDYPDRVVVPQESPLELGGGVTITGRIVATESGFPALITLAAHEPGPPYHGLTNENGAFSIPGVRPGKYRLTARPELGQGYKNPPIKNFTVAEAPVDLGLIFGDIPELELDSRVEVTNDLLPRILAEAKKHSTQPITRLWIGELTHPGGNFGARVTYQPVSNPEDSTSATRTMLIFTIPGESIRKYYPSHDSLGYGFQFSDAAFEQIRTFEHTLRVFPLESTTLYVPLEKGVPYDVALALLKAIETNTIETPEPVRRQTGSNSWSVSFSSVGEISAQELPEIRSIQAGPNDQIHLESQNCPFGGKSYQFKKSPTGFILVSAASWVS